MHELDYIKAELERLPPNSSPFIVHNIEKRIRRLERYNKFIKEDLPFLHHSSKVDHIEFSEELSRCTFFLKDESVFDFYPKSNKILFRKTNTWKDMGLRYIKTKL